MHYFPKDKEFQRFANSEGISSSKLNYYQNQIQGSMTPYILEEREMRVILLYMF